MMEQYIYGNKRISIQVSLSGYSFEVDNGAETVRSAWMEAGQVFTTPEFQQRYEEVYISLFTPKFTLIPKQFFNTLAARELLADVTVLNVSDLVEHVAVPDYGAVLVYSNSIGETLSKTVADTVRMTDGNSARVLPEIYFLLAGCNAIPEYNKIAASYMDGYLYLVMAQGRTLLLCNVYEAADFTTAQYFIFLAMKKLQLNPEVSAIFFRTALNEEQSMSLYRYFRSVEII